MAKLEYHTTEIPVTVDIPFQYIIYDIDAFTADVGGYLGLLLGQSIYGLYDMVSQWLGYKIMKWGNARTIRSAK